MKEEAEKLVIRSEPELAVRMHMDSLVKEYERIVISQRGAEKTIENESALELISLKIRQCEDGIALLRQIFND